MYRLSRLGSRKQLTFICGIAALTCALFLLNDVRKTTTVNVNPSQLKGQGTVRQTPGQTSPMLNAPVTSPACFKLPTGHPVHVLVVTYMRSGSSLTGDILQQADEAFYVYEPFRLLQRAFVNNHTLVLLNGTKRTPPFDTQNEAVNVIRDWFTCNVRNLYRTSLTDGFLSKGLKTQSMSSCLRNETARSKNKTLALDICAQRLQDLCLKSPFRIIKTIRISIASVKHLVKEIPNFKIIHLVRDPRATLLSQSKFGMCSGKSGGQSGCTNEFCKLVENDVLEEEQLLKTYPKTIMPLFYEDLALYPLQTAKAMFEFVGARFSRDVERYVYNLTMAGNPDNCVTCTTRANASHHVHSWKQNMKPNFIATVQERCNYILKRYNYPLV